MKRRTFFPLFLAAGALLTVPVAQAKRWLKTVRDRKGFRVTGGADRAGRSITLLEGDTFYTKVSTADSDGDVYVFESTREKKGGPALHYHFEQDEWWYVLQGEFLFKVGDETFTAKAGDSVFGPRMVPHAFAKTSEGEARLLMFYQPAGKMEAYFQALSQGAMAKMSDDEQASFRKAHGIVRTGPALAHLKQ
ncbi:MAG: cupin domain-containing protein [Janthinobacterium lividum]